MHRANAMFLFAQNFVVKTEIKCLNSVFRSLWRSNIYL